PIPWRAPEVGRAGTVHLGATAAEIIDSERACWEGRYAERPFVLLAQQSLFDATRAPAGKHTPWAYCHVPPASTVDMRDRIDARIERFAPGFRDRILAARTHGPTDLERSNANLVGGDISAGASHLTRLLRPLRYATPVPWLYLCSAATVPGPGVHGMCGHNAARAALRRPAGSPFEGEPPPPRGAAKGGSPGHTAPPDRPPQNNASAPPAPPARRRLPRRRPRLRGGSQGTRRERDLLRRPLARRSGQSRDVLSQRLARRRALLVVRSVQERCQAEGA